MNFITLLVVVVVAALAALALFNWPAISAVTSVSLGMAHVQAPLGLLLLAFTAALGLLFVVHSVVQQTRAGSEARRHAKELAAQRDLADRAEASRFSELRAFLDAELRRLDAQAADQRAGRGAERRDPVGAARRQARERFWGRVGAIAGGLMGLGGLIAGLWLSGRMG